MMKSSQHHTSDHYEATQAVLLLPVETTQPSILPKSKREDSCAVPKVKISQALQSVPPLVPPRQRECQTRLPPSPLFPRHSPNTNKMRKGRLT